MYLVETGGMQVTSNSAWSLNKSANLFSPAKILRLVHLNQLSDHCQTDFDLGFCLVCVGKFQVFCVGCRFSN